jgi:hypothetical protein
MLAQDVSPRVIMEVLGHSQISITMNTYIHLSEAQSREAANRMGDLFQFTFGDPLAAVAHDSLAANDVEAGDRQSRGAVSTSPQRLWWSQSNQYHAPSPGHRKVTGRPVRADW